MHTRSVRVDAFRRADGAWDLEAELVDVKPHDERLLGGVCPAGEPMHLMRLRVTIDASCEVIDVVAVSDAVPYRGVCEPIASAYRRLVGLNLLRGFRVGVRERLGGIAGCTHMSELAQILPTVAVQAMSGEESRRREQLEREGGKPYRPFTIDRCHAWRSDGPVVERHFPIWYRSGKDSDRDQDSSVSTEERP